MLTSDLPPCLDMSAHNALPEAAEYNIGGMKEGKRAPDCCRQCQYCLCMCTCMLLAWRPGQWPSDHRTFLKTPSSPPDVQLLSQVSLLVPGGRNYTGDDPVLLGLPAFQVWLSFVGWVWSYPPPCVATNELIPLMSSYLTTRLQQFTF